MEIYVCMGGGWTYLRNALIRIQWNLQIMDMLGSQPFVLCRDVVLF